MGPPLQSTSLVPRYSRTGVKGEFQILGIAPGRYRLRARAGGVTLRPDGSVSVSPAAQTEWAMSDITMTGSDVSGITLALQPGRILSGSLVAEGGTPPASWKGVQILVQAIVSAGNVSAVATRQVAVGDDGRFSVAGIEPYEYEVRVTLPAALANSGWRVSSVRHQGRDLRDSPLTFDASSLDGVEVVLTTAITELTGRLTSESGTPATDYYIVAFPDDRALWHAASPRVRMMRPAADGLFSTRDLPPGTYRIAALIDVEDDELRRRDFLESIYGAAVPVRVRAATSTTQDIRIK